MVKNSKEDLPSPKELEKEISEFLAKRFGENVKLMSPILVPNKAATDEPPAGPKKKQRIQFDLKPRDLIAYLAPWADSVLTPFRLALRMALSPHAPRVGSGRARGDPSQDLVA